MKINGINNQYQYNQSFKSLVITDKAKELIDIQPKAEQEEIKQIGERLEGSKYWDLEIDGLGNLNNKLCCRFINKQNPEKVHEYGLHPYKQEGNKVKVFSVIDPKSERLEELTFPNEASARAMIDMQMKESKQRRTGRFEDRPINNIRRWEQRVNFLNEAYEYMDKNGLIDNDLKIEKYEKISDVPSRIDFVIDDMKEKLGL